jgi:hypothetical protein
MHMERRRTERDRRGSWRVPIVCAVRNSISGSLHLGQSEDLGPGGITLRRPRDLPISPATALTLTFDLPGTGRTIDVEGLVVSDRRAGGFRRTGIRFVGSTPEQLALLSEFCRERS